MKEEIIELIVELTENNDIRKNPDINLLEEDILDSLAFIEIISRLEEMYDIEIQPTQIPSYTWEKIDNIVEMVEKLIAKK